jgi:hypothetical protein
LWFFALREFRLEGSEARAFNRKERKELPQSSQSNSNLSHYQTVKGGSASSRSHFFWISSGLFEAERASTTEDTGDTEGIWVGASLGSNLFGVEMGCEVSADCLLYLCVRRGPFPISALPSVREFRLAGSEERAFNRKERKETAAEFAK